MKRRSSCFLAIKWSLFGYVNNSHAINNALGGATHFHRLH